MKDINLRYIGGKVYIPFEEHYEMLKEEVKEKVRLKESISRIKDVYTSMQFSAPENMYIFIEQLGEILDKVENK